MRDSDQPVRYQLDPALLACLRERFAPRYMLRKEDAADMHRLAGAGEVLAYLDELTNQNVWIQAAEASKTSD